MFPKRFSHWLAANQFCSRICWWSSAKYRARYMSRSMFGTAWAGQWLTVIAPSGVNIYTQMERLQWMSWQLLHVHTHTHTPLNTDQENVVHQWQKSRNYGLLWLRFSKATECFHNLSCYALAQTDMATAGWMPRQKANLSAFYSNKEKIGLLDECCGCNSRVCRHFCNTPMLWWSFIDTTLV